MKIVFLLERPSQFDAPLFRVAGADAAHRFEAWFTAGDAHAAAPDPELGRAVDWGFDRAAGYRSQILPGRGLRAAVARELEREPVDLLILNGYTRRAYLEAAATARRRGVPTALRIDSVRFPGAPKPGVARRLLLGRLLPRLFDRFLVTGSLGRDYLLAAGVGDERLGRFTYAVDHAAFAAGAERGRVARAESRRALGVPLAARVVLSLTKFSDREAPWDLVDARARESRGDLHWVLAGDGPLRAELEAVTRARGLDRMHFPGYVPYTDLPRMYAAADLLVHPAREERWGVSVAEALACGLPVVTSDRVGAAYDLLAAGENGERYPAGDGAALAAAIARTLELSAERIAAASAPRLAEFGLEATWRQIVAAAAGVRRGAAAKQASA